MQQYLNPILIPVIADYVMSPVVIYGEDFTSITFETEDGEFGRITLQHMDALKICRGELPPYTDPTEIDDYIIGTWVYKVENSNWLRERYLYEKEHYEHTYEWGNTVEEMLSDFSHYFFRFHDEFVEVIAKGFWFEQAKDSFLGKSLTEHHPFLPLSDDLSEDVILNGKEYLFKYNPTPIETLEMNAFFCHQKLIEVWISTSNHLFNDGSLCIKYINHEFVSYYQPTFGKAVILKTGILTNDEFKTYLKTK